MSNAVKIRLPKIPKRVRVISPLPLLKEGGGAAGGPEGLQGAVCLDTLREESFRKGYARAAEEWSTRLSEVLASLDRESARLNECRREFLSSLEQSVVDLALAVAEKFLISERERGRYCIRAIVHSVLEKMEDGGGRLTIALNPKDLDELEEGGALAEADDLPTLKLVKDPSVPLAGCRVDTGLGQVAFSLEEQMEEIRKAISTMEVPENDGCDNQL